MAQSILTRVQNAWNTFLNRDPTNTNPPIFGSSSYGDRPDRTRLSPGTEKSLTAAIYNRVAIDVASINIRHIRMDGEGRYLETLNSGLNNCLGVEANIDQTGRALIQDIVMSMFDEGCVAIVPVDTDNNPNASSSYDILTMRTARVLEWFPTSVKVNLYDDRDGLKKEIIVPKTITALIENPLYAVMNRPNSTLRRLTRKLNLLDAIDEQSSSGKLDLIIQLPYAIKTDERKRQAEVRRKDLVDQLTNSKYGIGYTDGTEKITQLNRPIENNLMKQVEYLTAMLYSQLGITETILDGTADEKTMLNYYNRTIKPILSAITEEMHRTFLSKTARTQGQAVTFFPDPFRLVPAKDLAELADKFTRNEVMTSNEFRAIIGYKPSAAKGADELRNKNLNVPATDSAQQPPPPISFGEKPISTL
jgi:hypothetical protein